MKISVNIIIERNEAPGQKEKEVEKQQMQSLSTTEFPMGVMLTKPSDKGRNLSFSGTVEDFTKAVKIKKDFLAGEQTPESKKAMNAKLKPIYDKWKND